MTKAKRIRVTKTILRQICDELSQGKSLRSICDRNPDALPHYRTVLKEVQRNDEYFEMYQNARAIAAEVLSDAMYDLASQPLPEDMDPKFMNAEVQRRRLEVDTLKWTFARMQPKGIRNRAEDTAQQDNTITLTWGMQPDEPKRAAKVLKLVNNDDD